MIEVRGLSYRYRGSQEHALRDVSLKVGRGEFVVVAGPSGCGKSTLALAIGGYLFQQHDGEAEGSLCVAGLDARRAPIYDLAEVVGLVQQNPEAQFCTLSVEDEVAFGLENRRLPQAEIRRRLAWALEVVGAAHLAGRPLAALSGGEKQKVAIAAVLAGRPQVLILDEPTSNLDPPATAEIFGVIARLRQEAGITVIVIEHKLGYLRPFGPRLVTMAEGRIVRDGPLTTKETAPIGDLGGSASHPPAEPGTLGKSWRLLKCSGPSGVAAEPIVRVEGLHAGHAGGLPLQGLSLEVGPGECVALMGDNGSGKTTLLLSLLGLLKPQEGRVEVLGCDTRHTPVSQLARQVGFVFQNPDHQLFAESVWQEATFAPRNLNALDCSVEARVEALLAQSGLSARREDHPYRLSYGQKRRLNLASVLALAPRLILLDELLIGQDPANAAHLMGLLHERVQDGAAVIMVSHDPEVVRAYATRLLFLEAGRLRLDAPPEEAFRQLAALGRTAYLPYGFSPTQPLGTGAVASEVAETRASLLSPVGVQSQTGALTPALSLGGGGKVTALSVLEPCKEEERGLPPPKPSERGGLASALPVAARRRIAYQPGDSALHRLHPLLKAGWLLVGTAFVFAVRSPWAIVAVLALIGLAYALAGVRLNGVRGGRLFGMTALFLALLQLAFVRQGAVLLRVGPFAPTTAGLEAAVYVAGRFLAVIFLSYLFVLTTDPGDLAHALVRAGLPYRYGFALTTALRLVPVFEQEAQIVYSAQLARGVEYDVRSPQRLVRLAQQFSLPLLVSALGKVDSLAVSMEGRCFGKHSSRSYLKETRFQGPDWAVAALLALAAAGTLTACLL